MAVFFGPPSTNQTTWLKNFPHTDNRPGLLLSGLTKRCQQINHGRRDWILHWRSDNQNLSVLLLLVIGAILCNRQFFSLFCLFNSILLSVIVDRAKSLQVACLWLHSALQGFLYNFTKDDVISLITCKRTSIVLVPISERSDDKILCVWQRIS